jgi:hypothetical protein
MVWEYKTKTISSRADLLPDCTDAVYGFIYKITYKDNSYYFGKKNFYTYKTLPALLSGDQRPDSKRIGKNVKGKRKYFDVVKKESNWLIYEGSSEKTKKLKVQKKEILQLAYSKRELTYLEAKCLFWEEAIEDPNCHNSNILKLFFRDNIK